MKPVLQQSVKHSYRSLPLYRLVFTTYYAAFLSFFLLLSFLAPSLDNAFVLANTDAETEGALTMTESTPEPSPQEVPLPPDEHVTPPEQIATPVVSDNELAVVEDDVAPELPEVQESTAAESVMEESVSDEVVETEAVSEGIEILDTEIPTEVLNEFEESAGDAGSSDLGGDGVSGEEVFVGEDDSGALDDESATEFASTTEGGEMGNLPQAPPMIEGALPLFTGDHYQFERSACVATGNGGYYCTAEVATTTASYGESVYFAGPGQGGDSEIFVRTGEDITELTSNDFDDGAPQYDPASGEVVWHRLVDGRYQVVLYDIRSESERYITNNPEVNSMEPDVSRGRVVWQQWDGGDWEVAFFNGSTTLVLSDNAVPDLAPKIEDEYVMWTTVSAEGQQLEVYSIETGARNTVANFEGGAVVNPRFVLVYDTKFENGDTLTHTFDPKSGLSQPVASTPAPEPFELPPVEPTGETKALIQASKPSLKEDGVVESDTEPETSSSTTLPVFSGATSTNLITDVIVPEYSATGTVPALEPLPLSDYDLLITPEMVGSSTQLNDSD